MDAKRLIFSVTNDLTYDQRMIRICGSLSAAGYAVTLVGRSLPDSEPLRKRPFHQRRIRCLFEKGFLFYAEYNIRLLWLLLASRADLVCAIDLDTILPNLLASSIKGIPRVYDAHELFCGMKEVESRPWVHLVWRSLERLAVPRFRNGYTVSAAVSKDLEVRYGVEYPVIRNMAVERPTPDERGDEVFILYQGAVNEGRCFEELIPAMRDVGVPLHIYGDGNFMTQALSLAKEHGVEGKVIFMGKVAPEELHAITARATIGISLFEGTVGNNRASLANRFFDFIQARVPQLCSDLPEYRAINDRYGVAVMVRGNGRDEISAALNKMLGNEVLLYEIRRNCEDAARALNWEAERRKLFDLYHGYLP